MTAVLALDFDGVLCDSTRECLLVSWNAHHGAGIEAFGKEGYERLPAAFVERFTAWRGFARQLGHFLVPLTVERRIRSQREFDAYFARLDPEAVERFVRVASDYRERVRAERRPEWFRAHGMLHVGPLDGRFLPVYVVTARDADSVIALLGASVDASRVFGGLRSKLDALAAIAASEGVDPSRVLFVDDSAANVLEAQHAGYDARWANWGFGRPAAGVRTISAVQLHRATSTGIVAARPRRRRRPG